MMERSEVRIQARAIAEAVILHAERMPDACALADKEGPVTYGQLKDRMFLCAQTLKGLGVKPGDRVVMECTQDAFFVTVNLACQLLGAVFVGVERKVARGRLEEILLQTQPVLLVTIRKTEPVFLQTVRKTEPVPLQTDRKTEAVPLQTDQKTEPADGGLKYLTAKELKELLCQEAESGASFAEDGSSLAQGAHLERNRTAEIMFSTGTTGKTKGAVLTNGANVANAQNIIDGVQMEPDAVEMIPLPINHAHGLRTIYAHLLNGSCALIANGITFPRVLLDMMQKYGANAIDLSPSAANMLISTSEGRLKEEAAPSIRYVEVGTAFLPETTKARLRECFPGARLYNFYGSSESGRTCCLEFGRGKSQPGCIGRPVPNAHFAVLDEDGNPMESDAAHTGTLACAGPMNMSGYWREPVLSAETQKNGYVLTADVAYIDKDGYIYVLGRQDDVIVYKGIKISPEEIEEAAKGCSLVADCACIPAADALAGQVPKLFVVPEDPDSVRVEDIFAYLKQHIDDNRMPRTIELISQIPRTYNGKILRRELAK